jgi:hypothetical protein
MAAGNISASASHAHWVAEPARRFSRGEFFQDDAVRFP